MTNLYLILDIGSLALPLLFSFHPKLQFYKKWPALFLSILLMMLVFIPWDVIFTNKGIWGFNDTYFSGITFFSLPLEEWLFFICIPFACVFTHYSLLYFFPNMKLQNKHSTIITHVLLAISVVLCVVFYDKCYTFVNFLYAIILLLLVKTYQSQLLTRFFITFLVMLIPFFIVNGILTGSGIEHQVVWYNTAENLDFRVGTIPIEDIMYAFTMILTVLSLTEYFDKRFSTLKAT